MTHGMLVYINEEGKVFVSNDFNGDMYYEQDVGYGRVYAQMFAGMSRGLTIAQMSEWLYGVQKSMHDYEPQEVRFINKSDNVINFTHYFPTWFAEYLYIRNDAKSFKIVNRDGNTVELEPGVVYVYHCGRYENMINVCNTETEVDMIEDSTAATEEHRQEIARNVQDFCNKITLRAAKHDLSKLEPPEKEGFDKNTTQLSDITYNSPEYQKSLEALGEALKHHHANNDHHPEYYENGVWGMNLYSLVEMYEDWKASAKRTKDGDILKSVVANKGKFALKGQLYSILLNTAKMDLEEQKRMANCSTV